MPQDTRATNTKQISLTVREAAVKLTQVLPANLGVLRTDPVDGDILNHGALRDAIKLAKLGHRSPGLQTWVGHAGVGKTVAARQLVHEINQAADGAFRARYLMMGGDVDHASQRQMKRGIYALWAAIMDDTLAGGRLRQLQEDQLAMQIVEQVQLERIQFIVIDEAGTKNEKEIRGLTFVSDLARNTGWPLPILLVGMDDLAHKVAAIPALESRRRYIKVFEPWDKTACLAFMVNRSAAIAARVAANDGELPAALNLIMKDTSGRLREVESLLVEIDARLKPAASVLDVVQLVLDWRAQSERAAIALADQYVGRLHARRIRNARLTASEA